MPAFQTIQYPVLFAIGIALNPAYTLAAATMEAGDSSVDALENAANSDIGIMSSAIISRQQFANYINNSGRAIDRFISQKILRQTDNDFSQSGARARLSWHNAYIDKQGFKTNLDFKINLDLSQSKRHLRLVIQSDKQPNIDDDPSITPVLADDSARKLSAGFEYLWNTYQEWQPSFTAAVRWKKLHPEPYARARLHRTFGDEQQKIEIEPSMSYYHKSHTHYELRAHYFKKITNKWSWRFDNGIHLTQTSNKLQYFHSPSIQFDINQNSRWQNQWIISGDNTTASVYNQALFSSRLISKLYHNWLLLELEPRLTIDLKRHSKLRQQPAIYLRMHVLFNR